MNRLFKTGEFVEYGDEVYEILDVYNNKMKEITEFCLLNIITNKAIMLKLDDDNNKLSQEFNLEKSQLIQNYLKLEELKKQNSLLETQNELIKTVGDNLIL